jgi:4-amino-4-deoxy-L-arabinose transferase-like glycosyltransferase
MTQKKLNYLLMAYCLLAALSMYLTLWLPYVGEEGVYVLGAIEMAHHHNYLKTTLFGRFYGRPPLYDWLLIGSAKLFGWKNILLGSRFITATAAVASGAMLFMLTKKLTKIPVYAWLCMAIYLTGDTLIRHGWIAYTDPVLSFFIFSSIACLWLGLEGRRVTWLFLAAVFVCLGVLTKALTPYVFYGLTALVLLWRHPNRWYLFRPQCVLVQLLMLAFPFVWAHFSDPAYLKAMFGEMLNTAFAPALKQYFIQVVFYQPIMLVVHLMPFSVLAFYSWWRSKEHTDIARSVGITAIYIAMLCFLPCWFAPRWPEARYYMPVYPVFAIYLGYLFLNANGINTKQLKVVLIAMLVLKVLFVAYFYYFQNTHRAHFKTVAVNILQKVGDYPIYVDPEISNDAPMNSVGAQIDLMRHDQPPMVLMPNLIWDNAYLISRAIKPRLKKIGQYPMHNQTLYLYCRGHACVK